jgi:ABC-2 type transport system permease protein
VKAFLNHFSFEFRTGIRNKTLLMLTYLFPILVYLLLGVLMTSVNPTFGETMIPAMVIFAILSGTLLSVPDSLVVARKAGIFRSYRINGVPATSILLIPLLSSLFHLLIVSAVITITAPLLFRAPIPVNWPGFIAVFVLTVIACAGLALLIGVISSNSQMTVLWAQIIFLPSMILGGLMLPTSILPSALSKFALLLPTTYAMNAFRGLAMNLKSDFNPLWSVFILFVGGLLSFALALYLFYWDDADLSNRRKTPLGLLALLPYLAGAILLSLK